MAISKFPKKMSYILVTHFNEIIQGRQVKISPSTDLKIQRFYENIDGCPKHKDIIFCCFNPFHTLCEYISFLAHTLMYINVNILSSNYPSAHRQNQFINSWKRDNQ